MQNIFFFKNTFPEVPFRRLTSSKITQVLMTLNNYCHDINLICQQLGLIAENVGIVHHVSHYFHYIALVMTVIPCNPFEAFI